MTRYQAFLYAVQFIMASLCLWSCFCRLVRTNAETIREIRWAITLQFAVCLLLICAPFIPLLIPELATAWKPLTTPGWVYVLAVSAMALMQLVYARNWVNGVPQEYQRSTMLPHRPVVPWLAAAVLVFGAAVAYRAVAGEEADIIVLKPGQTLECAHATGCVAMTRELAEAMVAAAQHGQACRKRSI